MKNRVLRPVFARNGQPDTPPDSPVEIHDFAAHDIDMALLLAQHDWSKTDLGPPEDWPKTLQTVVSLILDSKVPMWVAWGPSIEMVYNAPYSLHLGNKHPHALGRPYPEVWKEIWQDVSVYVDTALSGEGVYKEDFPLYIDRYGKRELIWASFSASPVRDDKSIIRGLVCTVWETTGKMLVQQQVSESRTRLLALMQASSNVVYRATGDWREMIEVDGRGFLVDTLSPDRNWQDKYLHPIDRANVVQAIETARQNRTMYEFEHRVPLANGSLGWVLSRAVPILDDDGEIFEWFGTAVDITARKEAETRLSEEARAKDEFLATLAHELRNPLAPIRSGLQLISKGVPLVESDRILSMLDRQVDHLVHLIDDLMDVARINSGALRLQRKRVNLSTTLTAAFDLSRPTIESRKHQLRVCLQAEPLWVNGDEVRLTQVFSNLLNNAAIYTHHPGVIDVTLGIEGGQAIVRIKDEGIGISAEDQTRLFTLFRRLNPTATHGDGLGVGLSLAKRLLEMHEGTISISSAGKDRGSCFIVKLPLIRTDPAFAPPVAKRESSNLSALKITVIDDNHDAADSLGALLETMGCTVQIYYSGVEALQALDTFNPHAVLLDIGMPELDGFEVARRIRAQDRHRNALLVAVTGWGQPEDRAKTKSAGFDHHLVKPVGVDLLVAALDDVSHHHAQRGYT